MLDKIFKWKQPLVDNALEPCGYQWRNVHIAGHSGVMSSSFVEYLYVFPFQDRGILVVPFAITSEPQATGLLFSQDMKLGRAPTFSAMTREEVLVQAFEYYPLPSYEDYSPPSEIDEDGESVEGGFCYCERGVYRGMRYYRLNGGVGTLYLFPADGGERARVIALWVASSPPLESVRVHVFCIEIQTAFCQQEDFEGETLEALFDCILSRERPQEMRQFMLHQFESLCSSIIRAFAEKILPFVGKLFATLSLVPLSIGSVLGVTAVDADLPHTFLFIERPLLRITAGMITLSCPFLILLPLWGHRFLAKIVFLYGNRLRIPWCMLLLLMEVFALLSVSYTIVTNSPLTWWAIAIVFSLPTLPGWWWLSHEWGPFMHRYFASTITRISFRLFEKLHRSGIYPHGVGMIPPWTFSAKLVLVRDYMHVAWFGNEPHVRRVRIYQSPYKGDQPSVHRVTAVVCSALSPDWDKHKAARIAAEVWRKENLPYPLIWIEHKRKRYSFDEFLYAHFCCKRNHCFHRARWFYLDRYRIENLLVGDIEDLGTTDQQGEFDDWEW